MCQSGDFFGKKIRYVRNTLFELLCFDGLGWIKSLGNAKASPRGTCHLRFSGIRPLRGYPSPLLTENQSEKKKVFFLSGKGGYPPPLNGKSAKLFREIFS